MLTTTKYFQIKSNKMSKTLKIREVAALKRTAQNNYPLIAKREKLIEQMAELQKEFDVINAQIEGAETGSKAMTGGFTSLDLIERQVIPTGKLDTNGKEIKVTKFVPKEGALALNEDGGYDILLTIPEAPAAPAEEAPEAPENQE